MVEGTPLDAVVGSTAARSARANALNEASTMWCALVPASTRTCSGELGGVRHRAEELLGQVGVEVAPRARRGKSPSKARERPARRRRSRSDARASSIGTTAWPKRRMPGAVAERLVERLAERDARCPRPCGAGRSRGRPPRCTSRSRPPWRATASSRWSKKPTPVVRSPAPAPSRSSDSWTSVSPVVRWICAVRLTRGAPSTRRARESPRRGPGRRRRARGGRRASPGKDTRAMRRRNVAGESARLEARGAAGGQHVVGAGDVVAERRGRRRRPTNRQPAPRTAAGQRLGLLADQLEVLGRDLARRARSAPRGVARRDHLELGVAPRSAARRPAARPRPTTASSSSRVGRDQPRAGCPSPCSAWASRSSAISSGSAPPPAATTTSSLGPGDAVDAHLPDHLALGLLHVGVARARRSRRRRAHRLGAVGQRGDRLGAAHPVDLGRPRRARRPPGSPGAPAARARAARTPRSPRRPPRARSPRPSRPSTGRARGRPGT